MTAVPPAGLDPEPVTDLLESTYDGAWTPRDRDVARLAAAAERARIRALLLACVTCGEVHHAHQAAGVRGEPYTSWAAPDGHPYQTRFRDGQARQQVADLLAGDP